MPAPVIAEQTGSPLILPEYVGADLIDRTTYRPIEQCDLRFPATLTAFDGGQERTLTVLVTAIGCSRFIGSSRSRVRHIDSWAMN